MQTSTGNLWEHSFIKRTISGIASPTVILLIFFILYISYPSGFSTTDAWYYAAAVRHDGELFHPFHLLYNLLGKIFCIVPVSLGFDVLGSLKVMNAVFAVAALLALQLILRKINIGNLNVTIVTLLTGSSFAFMRYATENETYIVPLAFALFSSLFFLRHSFNPDRKHIILSALMASLAVLFHLTYIIWWLVILAGFMKPFRLSRLLTYTAVSLIIPAAYLFAALFSGSGGSIASSVESFTDQVSGNVSFILTFKGLMLGLISLVRSFIQVHGYMFSMVRETPLWIIPALISTGLFIGSLFYFPDIRSIRIERKFAVMHFYILLLNFLFALISFGNAEFMVMIPAITFLILMVMTVNYERFFLFIASGMLIWNISYGLLPLSSGSGDSEKFLLEKSAGGGNLIISSDDQLLISYGYYETGKREYTNILKSPSAYRLKGYDPGSLAMRIDSALLQGRSVYTDCIGEAPLSRASIIAGETDSEFFSRYETVTEKEWYSRRGAVYVKRITGKIR